MSSDATPRADRSSIGLRASLQSLWNEAIDLIYPPQCGHCERVGRRWCPTCSAVLAEVPIDLLKRQLTPDLVCLSSAVHRGILRDSVHSLKYDRAIALAVPLGERLSKLVGTAALTIDSIIPVPLHTARLRERGYNQSEALGAVMAEQLHIPLQRQALVRLKQTPAQVGLNAAQRRDNLRDAFRADSASVSGMTVVLIDDVITTGTTLWGCAQTLRQAGVRHILCLTVTSAL